MTIQTEKGEIIRTRDGATPEFHETPGRVVRGRAVPGLWYVPGYRWIKSRSKFSGNCLIHSFESWTEVADPSAA